MFDLMPRFTEQINSKEYQKKKPPSQKTGHKDLPQEMYMQAQHRAACTFMHIKKEFCVKMFNLNYLKGYGISPN